MDDNTKIPLVSSEITGIWNSYMGENLLICKLKHHLNSVEDTDTLAIMKYTLDLSNQRIKVLTDLFNQEKLPIPGGFSDNEVNINAPRLFTDTFYLQYMAYASKVAMQNYTLILNNIARSDVRNYFSKCIQEYIDLYNRSAELRLSKGIFVRAPHVEVPKEVQYIKDESFMLDWFGEKRPLLTLEITHIFSIASATILRSAQLIGFAQVSKDKKISDYMLRGKELATKQNNAFNSILAAEGIPIPSSSDLYVTQSTVAPFSEKLMLYKIMIMCSEKIGSLGFALADIQRSDLQSMCIKFMDAVMKYAKDGADIMIDNGWSEQPPQAIRHENLVEV
ncbi:DUF3231 family protein [Clostridium algoriphilum]|uniref:DUF3231 family protein n=1 Tax=Clostridium algoriphilum TaxID=198347 RepID=UPI001CF1E9A0|nr:DUF3231 family protein [Clostridium algoriphilum]MCB2293459.1 DUF3231 family protein [Clostridium algoriphilum]